MAFIFMARVSREEELWDFAGCPISLGTARKAECTTGSGKIGAGDDTVMVAARPPRRAAALSPYLARIRHEEAGGGRHEAHLAAGARLSRWRTQRDAPSGIRDARVVSRR